MASTLSWFWVPLQSPLTITERKRRCLQSKTDQFGPNSQKAEDKTLSTSLTSTVLTEVLNRKGKESKEADLKRVLKHSLVPTWGYKTKLEKAGAGFLCGAVTVTSLSLSWGKMRKISRSHQCLRDWIREGCLESLGQSPCSAHAWKRCGWGRLWR